MTDSTSLQQLVPLAFGVRLAALALAFGLAARPAWCRRLAFSGSILASALTGAAGLAVVLGAAPVHGALLRHAASGVAFGYAIAPLAAWFLVVLAALAICMDGNNFAFEKIKCNDAKTLPFPVHQ